MMIGSASQQLTTCCANASKCARTKIGIVADLGTLQRIGRIVGSGHAREMAFTGGDIDATRAAQIGLVNKVMYCWPLVPYLNDCASDIATNTCHYHYHTGV
jgi:enoyl-CoA hydratase/carnithine racemase